MVVWLTLHTLNERNIGDVAYHKPSKTDKKEWETFVC